MQARDPKRDRPTGPIGRPAFGVGPIARVSRPPTGASTEAPPSAPRPDTDAGVPPRSTSSVRYPTLRPAPSSAPPRAALPGMPGRGGLPIRSPLPAMPPSRGGFGLPNLRRNVCPHFYMTGSRGAIPIQAPHLLKALIRQDTNVSRCQLRGGVHLEQGYVNDVCLTPRFNQCVFYEDDLTRE
mgnify:CR=1 FL=1